MATHQFKEPSPYSYKAPSFPPEDVVYRKYIDNLHLSGRDSNEIYGFALFGIGRAGTIHLNFLIKSHRIKLLYIVEDSTQKWKDAKQYYHLNDVTFLTSKDADRVFKDPKIRAVVVASPTFTHEIVVKSALEHHKAVFCEKPISETYEHTKDCYLLAKKVGQPLFSAFNRRFDPSYNLIQKRVRSGEIGHVLVLKVCSRDSPLPSLEYLKISGGIFHDCAVHDIDMALFILGEYPNTVSVTAKANIPEIASINDYDTVAITLGFESGTIVVIDLSRHSTYGYDQRLEVFGQKGMIKAENCQPVNNVETYTNRSVEKAPIEYSFPSRYCQGYQNEMEHFLEVLDGKAELSVSAQDTLAVSRIALACEESVKTGKKITMNWDEL